MAREESADTGCSDSLAMPSAITLEAMLVWLVVGFCVGFGWALGGWIVGKIFK